MRLKDLFDTTHDTSIDMCEDDNIFTTPAGMICSVLLVAFAVAMPGALAFGYVSILLPAFS